MGRVQTPDLVEDLLEFNLSSDAVGLQDVYMAVASLAANSKARDTLWTWFQANFARIEARLSQNPALYARYVTYPLKSFASAEREQEIRDFFKDKDTKAFDKVLEQSCDSIKRNAGFLQRNEQVLREWLEAHGYA